MSDDYALLLAFDTDAPEFSRGFEAGRLWEQMKLPDEFEQTIHASNAEMAMRMAEHFGRCYGATLDGNWVHLSIGCPDCDMEKAG